MLTHEPGEPLAAAGHHSAYQCWAAAYPYETTPVSLGIHAARNPRLALRWLQHRAQEIIDQLDPPHARPGLHWLTDEAEHERVLSYLAAGTAYQLTLYDENTHYVLVASPPAPPP
ncbi:hypothetical protein [Streptomyces sp. GC420]|uniref:hypothetical protein n=1 Tax=Streptomyces sp. GC420 TaxID=2697568 RepID=UPI001414D642|nr:hypothetical protein [Streptomyces sp. GC420]NBM17084.1 hypothetical protein [Streptomyces sp. GC420]